MFAVAYFQHVGGIVELSSRIYCFCWEVCCHFNSNGFVGNEVFVSGHFQTLLLSLVFHSINICLNMFFFFKILLLGSVAWLFFQFKNVFIPFSLWILVPHSLYPCLLKLQLYVRQTFSVYSLCLLSCLVIYIFSIPLPPCFILDIYFRILS